MGDEEYYAKPAADRETLMEIARRASENAGYTDQHTDKRGYAYPKSSEKLNYDPVPPEVILDIADYFRANDWMAMYDPLYVSRVTNRRTDDPSLKDKYYVYAENVFWEYGETNSRLNVGKGPYAAFVWDAESRDIPSLPDCERAELTLYDLIREVDLKQFEYANIYADEPLPRNAVPLSDGAGATLTDAHEAYLRAAGEIPIFDSMPSCVPGKEALLEYDFRTRILPSDPTKCRVYIGNALGGNSEIDDKITHPGYLGTYFDTDGSLIKASERKSMLRFLDSSIGWQESQTELGKAAFTDQDFEEYARILREVAPKLPGFREKAFSIDPDSIRGTRICQPEQGAPEGEQAPHRKGR